MKSRGVEREPLKKVTFDLSFEGWGGACSGLARLGNGMSRVLETSEDGSGRLMITGSYSVPVPGL